MAIGSCSGDSGGPLMYTNTEGGQKWIQIATVQGAVRNCGDEDYPGIYIRCQFHQRFMCALFLQIFCQSQNVTRKSCQNDVCTKNLYVKTLMKLTPGVTITHIVWAVFLQKFFEQIFLHSVWVCIFRHKKIGKKLHVKCCWNWLQAGWSFSLSIHPIYNQSSNKDKHRIKKRFTLYLIFMTIMHSAYSCLKLPTQRQRNLLLHL